MVEDRERGAISQVRGIARVAAGMNGKVVFADGVSMKIEIDIVPQRLRVLPGYFVVDGAAGPSSQAATAAVATVFAPDCTTSVRRVEQEGPDTWNCLYGDESAHELDVPGMAVSVLAPLAASSISIFVVSTLTADLILVPTTSLDAAVDALRLAGHVVSA
jgi:hypothetical protein